MWEKFGARVRLLPILGLVTGSGAPWEEGLVVLGSIVFGKPHCFLAGLRNGGFFWRIP